MQLRRHEFARTARLGQDKKWLEDAIGQPDSLDILQWRQKAQSFAAGTLALMGGGRGHPKFRAQTFLKAPGDDAPDDLVDGMRQSADEHNRAVMALEALLNMVGGTVKKDVVQRTTHLLEASDRIFASRETLTKSVEEFGTWKSGQSALKAATKKKSSFKIGQYMRPLEKGGVPTHLAKYLVSSGFFAPPEGVDESSWPVLTPSNVQELKTDDAVDQAVAGPYSWLSNPMAFNFQGTVEPGAPNRRMCRFVLVPW